MKLQKLLWLLLSISSTLLLVGCEYETDEKYFKEIDNIITYPEITVQLPLNQDTIYYHQPYYNQYSHYYVDIESILGDKELYTATFFVNNISVDSKYNYNSSGNKKVYFLDIDYNNYPDNTVRIKAEFVLNTGTGSLADKTKNETIVFTSKEWVIIRDPYPNSLNSSIEDGRLKLTWPASKNKNVVYYIEHDYIIDSTLNNWYIDSSFVGGLKRYTITTNDYKISSFYLQKEFIYEWPVILVNNTDSFHIYWDKPLFYNNIKNQKLMLADNTIIDINKESTGYTLKNWIYGNSIYPRLLLYPYKQKNNNDNMYSTIYPDESYNFELNLFKDISIGRLLIPKNGTNIYLIANDGESDKRICTYSIINKKINAKTLFTLDYAQDISISPNGKFIIATDNYNNVSLFGTDEQIPIYYIPAERFKKYGYEVDHRITDNGKTLYYDDYRKALICYNLIGEEITHEIPVNPSLYNYQYEISGDGEYIYNITEDCLLKLTTKSYETIWRGTSNYRYENAVFSPINHNELYVYDKSFLYLKSCTDFSTLRSYPLNDEEFINIDFNTNKYMTYKNYVFNVYSLQNGNKIESIKTTFSNYYERCNLFNDYIITSLCQYKLNSNN